MKLGLRVPPALRASLVQWELMVLLVPKAQRALQVPLGLLAWQGPLDLQDHKVARDLQEFAANRVIQEFQVSKEKLVQKGNQDHMVFRVQ